MKYNEVEKRLNKITYSSKEISNNINAIFEYIRNNKLYTKVPLEILNLLDSTTLLAYSIQTDNISIIYDFEKEEDFERI